MDFKRFNWHRGMTKNTTIEIEGYNGKKIGIMIQSRIGYDHPGFTFQIGLWYTFDIHLYDNRHQEEINAQKTKPS